MYINYLVSEYGKRKQLGLLSEQLSESCGISSIYIGIIERGHRKPSVGTLVKITIALNVNTGFLLCDRVNFDSEAIIEKATYLLNDRNEDEIRYTYEIVLNTRKFINEKEVISCWKII